MSDSLYRRRESLLRELAKVEVLIAREFVESDNNKDVQLSVETAAELNTETVLEDLREEISLALGK